MLATNYVKNNKNYKVIDAAITLEMPSIAVGEPEYEREYFKAAGRFYKQCMNQELHTTCTEIKEWVRIQMKYSYHTEEEVIEAFGYML